MKYDFEMETDESTSVGKIVAQIKKIVMSWNLVQVMGE